MKEKTPENVDQKSLVPQMFSPEDRQILDTLKGVTENMLKQRQETTNQLGEVAKITGHVASIADSSAKIRQSDNNVFLMSQAIAADKEKWHDMLTHIFSGRDKTIDAFITQIENGTKANNNELILQAMSSLTTVVAASPWPNFDSFKKLIDSGGEIELF
jgi:hypothetical protein